MGNGGASAAAAAGSKYGAKKHSNPLPNVQEYQSNIGECLILSHQERKKDNLNLLTSSFPVNEADLFDLGCMSPLYASPPHSPSSDVSSPGQQQHGGDECASGEANAKSASITDNHFTRDTHMRIILGNSNLSSGKGENGGAQS